MKRPADLRYIYEESSSKVQGALSPLGVRLRKDRVGIGRGLKGCEEGEET